MAEPEYGPESWSPEEWKELFRGIVGRTVRPGENVEDVVAGGWVLAERRAALLGRPMEPGEDVPYALAIFCWWPFKPSLRDDSKRFLYDARGDLFSGAALSGRWSADIREIIPDDILTLGTHELFETLRNRPVWEFIQVLATR